MFDHKFSQNKGFINDVLPKKEINILPPIGLVDKTVFWSLKIA